MSGLDENLFEPVYSLLMYCVSVRLTTLLKWLETQKYKYLQYLPVKTNYFTHKNFCVKHQGIINLYKRYAKDNYFVKLFTKVTILTKLFHKVCNNYYDLYAQLDKSRQE